MIETIDFDNLYALQADADVMKYIDYGVRTESEVMTGLEKAILHQKNMGLVLVAYLKKKAVLLLAEQV